MPPGATVSTVIEVLNETSLHMTADHIEKGIYHLRKNTGFMGRMEILGRDPLIVLDCAHNVAGIEKALNSVAELYAGELHVVYGTSSDKDLKEIATVLPSHARYYFTEFSNPRSAKIGMLRHIFQKTGRQQTFFTNAQDALTSAKQSANKSDTILIFGSFFLISDFFEDFFS